MNDLGKASAYIALFSEIAFVLLVAVLAGVLGGYWLDQRLGTIPIFVLVGFAIGASGGAIGCWRLIARFLDQLDDDDRR
ncbi:MAG TPA: AtpZ/AtpI family protein [Candidatus Limnocylindrales bacterium]|jgi:F0F1-type ATP synthase assembly protein I